jgi:hypothetical protein
VPVNGKELVPKEYMTMFVVTTLRKLDLKIDKVCVCLYAPDYDAFGLQCWLNLSVNL